MVRILVVSDNKRTIICPGFIAGTSEELSKWIEKNRPTFIALEPKSPEGRQMTMKILARVNALKQITLPEGE